MRANLLLLIAFFFSFNIKAQPVERNLLQKYSKAEMQAALINRADWKPFPKTPEAWRKVLSKKEIDRFISLGDSALKKGFNSLPATLLLEYVRIGNRSNYEKQSFTKRTQLWDLVLAESMEGKGRFTDKIMDGVWSICEETFWGVPAHLSTQKAGKGLADAEDPIVDLFAAETASVLAWTDYFVGDKLDSISKLLRPRIAYEVNRRIFKPIMVAKYNWLMKPDPNNWVPWIMSNCIASSLLLEKDEKKRSDLVYFAMKNVDKYINNLGDDGAVDEGPGYWFGAVGCVFDALDLLKSATNGQVSIFQEPIIDKMAAYIYKMHISGNYFINVADASPKLTPDGIALYRFGKSVNDKKLMDFGSWIYHNSSKNNSFKEAFRSRKLFNILAESGCNAYPATLPEIGDVWFPSIQLMATHGKELFLASHGGHNAESHNHNDVGDFIVYAAGYPVIIDVGVATYTAKTFSSERYKLWFNRSAFHNLPIINGAEQLAGREAKATEVSYQRKGEETSLSMNIASAYPASVVNSWKRTVKLKAETVQIIDDYKLPKSNNTISQVFMTVCSTKIEQPGKIVFELPNKQLVTLNYNASDWEVKKEKVALYRPEDSAFKSSWEGKDIWRLILFCKNGRSSGKSTYTIKLQENSE